MLSVDDASARSKSRLVALRISILTLRLMENWRRPFKDYDSAMILLAIGAIGGEKLTRSALEQELQDLARPMPRDRLTPCNINSIAAATGLNRETTRRKVNKLIAAGLVDRAEDGSITFSAGFSQREEPSAIVRTQLETLNRITNELVRDGALKWSRPDT
jgi:DNA-binding transcriptional ArsR family regulator